MSNPSSGLENVLKTISKTFKGGGTGGGGGGSGSSSISGARARIQPALVGGVADLEQLFDKLQAPANTVSVSDKIKAVELIRASVEESAVSSIPEIWYNARHLISSEHQTECRRAGLRLMNSCIAHDEHSVGTRISYYKSIIKHSNLEDFDLQLEALKTLTNNGRDLLDLYQSGYPLPHVLWSWLKRLANEAQEIRIGRKKDITLPWGTSMDENFHEMLKFIINTLKFNIAAYEEPDLEVILRETVGVVKMTSSTEDISLICDLINTVMVYGIIPINSLKNILEILCGISISVKDLADKVWDSVLNLAKSHIGNSTIFYLCQILEDTHRTDVNSNTMRGAARFLQKLLTTFSGGVDKSPASEPSDAVLAISPKTATSTSKALLHHLRDFEIPMTAVLHAYRKSLDVESVRHSLEICGCIYDLLANEKTRDCIGYELWESKVHSPLEIIFQISRTASVQQRSRAGTSKRGSTSSKTPAGVEEAISQILDSFLKFFDLLAKLLQSKQFKGPNEVVVDFFIDMCPYLDEKTALVVIDHFAAMHYCNPMSTSWIENTDTLLVNFYFDFHWSAEVRLRILAIIKVIYILGTGEDQSEVVRDLIERVFSIIDNDNVDAITMQGLMDLFIYICQDCSYVIFTLVSDILMRQFADTKHHSHINRQKLGGGGGGASLRATKCKLIARAIAQLFVQVFRTLPRRSRYLYFNLVAICQRTINEHSTAFIEAARVLCRIRTTSNNNIYLSDPENAQIAANRLGIESPSGDSVDYLKGKLDIPSPILKRLLPGQELDTDGKQFNSREYEIDTTVFLDVVVNVLEFGSSWEVYSFIWVHFPPQLANMQLFSGCNGEILRLRKLLCDQISNAKLPPTVILPADVNKHDIVILQIHTLSLLISYSDVFTKTDYDYIVQSLVLGLSSWERTAVPCIHALVVCCYECPLSVKKFLGPMFSKFQTKITATLSSPHILELLLSLSRLPWLTDNFTQLEYRRVFAMAFNYIKHANDLAQKSQAEDFDRIMSQYLLALAYSAISSWFLTIKLSNRRHMATYITRNLILADGRYDDIDEQSMATLDLISRFTYSDVDLKSGAAPNSNKGRDTNSWLYGKSIISIETDRFTGAGQIVVRRATGTALFNMKPDDKMIPKWIHDSALEKSPTGGPAFSPSYYLLQIVVPNDTQNHLNPIRLNDDPQTVRALGAIDRAPVVDFHKIGILYIGHGQSTEQEILANSTGSKEYRIFLGQIGRLIRLKGNRSVYAGGLDTEMDIDGEFAYNWSDKITSMIFHTATMMPPPTNPQDISISSKKRHIGNNHVTIFFDESGLPFKFGVIKSQFNFINIVITPHSNSFASVPTSMSTAPAGGDVGSPKNFYQVRAYKPDNIPDLFAACNVKIVSEESLPVFVRNLAIVASKFATVYHSQGQYVSNWRYRLQQINQLHDRVISQQKEEVQKQQQQQQQNNHDVFEEPSVGGGGGGASSGADVGLSFLDQLASAANPASNSSSPLFDSVEPSPASLTTTFVPDNDKGTDLPLLRSLDFSNFT